MSVFKEINKADKSGVTQFFRLSTENATVETNTAPDFYTFKGNVSTRAELPTSNLSTGDAYYIEDEDKVVFWTSGEWANVETYVINYNYENASNKPSINGHVLKGQMTAEDLDLQPAGDYLTEVPSEYITEDELAAEDYASKTYVMDQINNAEHFHREIVDALPLTGKDNVLYLVAKKGTDKDIYNEYIWTGTDYELMGTTAVDLSDYYVKEETNKLLDKKVDKVSGKGLSTNDYTTAEKTKLASLENYDDTAVKAELATLHNYDDTDIKNDITALKTADTEINNEITTLKKKVIKKIEYVRLVKSGDSWTWMNVLGDNLTFDTVKTLLGLEDTFLIIEDIENDGKMIPTRYDIDEDKISIWYVDISGETYNIVLSNQPENKKSLGFFNHILPHADTLPTTAQKGDIISIGDSNNWYIYDDSTWHSFAEGTEPDLSNYLAKDNTTGYAPTGNYNPATKKYVDDSVAAIHVPTKTSQLTNDSNFVIKTTNELTNYYTKNNTYTKNEVNALVAGGSGGDSKIETLDITGGKDITALLNEGNHIYYLTCDNENDSLKIYIRTIEGKQDTISLFKSAIVSLYYTAEDNSLLLSYFGGSDFSSPNYGTFTTEGSEITKRSRLDETRYTDINYISSESGTSAATLTSSYINMFLDKKTISVYLNGSESTTDLEFPKNTIIIGRNADFVTRRATGLIIFPTGVLYKITSASIVELHIEELSFATKSYADNCRLENSTPIEGTNIFGWYATTQDGAALTHATPQMIESIAIGEVYEWPSNVYTDGTNSAVVTGITKSYDHWSATRASGGESNYKEFIVYMGNHNVYTFAFDDTTVYKNYYPGDK